MNKTFLIPANSKKSMLIFGYFNTVDLILFCCGVGLSFLLMMFLPMEQFAFAVMAIAPGSIAFLLVFPIPNYHNVRTVINNVWVFYTTRQKYIWKGWCFDHGETSEE